MSLHPKAVLLDLDDTILDDSSLVHECWRDACSSHAERLNGLPVQQVVDAIRKVSKWYWDDPERHRIGRLDLDAARCRVVSLAFDELGLDSEELAAGIGEAYARERDRRMAPLPDAIETVRWLRESGRRLALLTNGAGPAQRRKIARFGLDELFDAILVEGELGFGKPDPRVYCRALEAVGADPAEAWMAGDNLEWDVVAPQRLGLAGIWVNRRGAAVPAAMTMHPRYIVANLSDLRALPPLL